MAAKDFYADEEDHVVDSVNNDINEAKDNLKGAQQELDEALRTLNQDVTADKTNTTPDNNAIVEVKELNNDVDETINQAGKLQENYVEWLETARSKVSDAVSKVVDFFQGKTISDGVSTPDEEVKSKEETIQDRMNKLQEAREKAHEEMGKFKQGIEIIKSNNEDSDDQSKYGENAEYYAYAGSTTNEGNNVYGWSMFHIDLNKIGLSREELDLYLENHSILEVSHIFNALAHNCPENISLFNFNPTIVSPDIIRDATESGVLPLKKELLEDITTNYVFLNELVEVNHQVVHFLQILPKSNIDADENGINNVELKAYNLAKANVINTLTTLPQEFISCIINDNNLIVMGSNRKLFICDDDEVRGFYSFDKNNISPGSISLNTEDTLKGSPGQSNMITVSSIIHELAHKFDDASNGSNNGLATYNSEEWKGYQKQYYKAVSSINAAGYDEKTLSKDEATPEFYAECVKLYFTKGEDLKSVCSPVYDAITEQLGGTDYGDAYNKNIGYVLSQRN